MSVGYRSNQQKVVNSSSDEDSDEDTQLWRQKKEKFFRKQNDSPMNSDRMQTSTDSGRFMQQRKKTNNIWGSVLTEQDLTQTLVSSATVDKPNEQSVNERNVESYDFTKKYIEDRSARDGDSIPEKSWSYKESANSSSMVTDSASGTSRGRAIIDYEDTVSKPRDNDDLRNRISKKSRKRRADFSGDRKHGSEIHKRLGDKKVTTTHVGEIDIDMELEDPVFVKKICDFLNEPKSELIGRIVEHLGKSKTVALRILKATKDVEETGGMYTMDGSRRRTPGGVYFTLLKQQPEFNNKVRPLIFVEDLEEYKRHRKEKRARARNKKRNMNKKPQNKGPDRDSDSKPGPAAMKVEVKPDVKADPEEMEDGEIPDDDEDEKPESNNPNSRNNSNSDSSSSEEDSPRNNSRKTFSFEEELAAAKKLIAERSKSKDSMDSDKVVEMTDLDVAEAHVVDIEIDG